MTPYFLMRPPYSTLHPGLYLFSYTRLPQVFVLVQSSSDPV